MKSRKIPILLGVILVFTVPFLAISFSYASKKLSLNLSKFHFGAQDPANKSMPKGLELARPWIFNWNKIEKTKGVYDWKEVDAQYKGLQKKKFKTLGVIIPFAKWDQLNRSNFAACKTKYKEAKKVGIEYVCNPVDFASYQKFIKKLVDRYDGDGKNDMPGLKIPVKAWEIWNEPEFEGDYYIGTARDYARLLDVTYRAIKSEDKKATVLNGGIASTGNKYLNFWKKVFTIPSGRNFDVISLHCITCSKEVLNVKEFNSWAKKNKIRKKRIWLTELQLDKSDGQGLSDEETALLLVKSVSYAFAHKVDKIFFVEFNYTMPKYAKTKKALGVLAGKLKNFKKAKKNTEFLGPDGKIIIGVYEFKMPSGNTVLVAWGGGTLSLGGTVLNAVDIYGNSISIENNVVNLGATPYIIETQ